MELIDVYLDKVSIYLQTNDSSKADIRNELESDIYAQIEEKEAAFQRSLNEDEVLGILQKLGPPLEVASQYMPQQYLIGPSLFPYFRMTLKKSLLVIFILHIAIYLMTALTTNDTSINSTTNLNIFYGLITTALVVTLIFAILERSGESFNIFDQWNAKTLLLSTRGVNTTNGDLITDIITGSITVLWLNDLIVFNNQFTISGHLYAISLSPDWAQIIFPLSLLLIFSVALSSYVLLANQWQKKSIILQIIIDLNSIGIALYLMQMDQSVIMLKDQLPIVIENLNRGMQTTFLIIAVITVFDLIKHTRIFYNLSK